MFFKNNYVYAAFALNSVNFVVIFVFQPVFAAAF